MRTIAIRYTSGKRINAWAKIQVPADLLNIMYPVGAHICAAKGPSYEVIAHC